MATKKEMADAATAAAAGETPAAAPEAPAKGLRVVGPKDGFWRGGRRFDRTPVVIPLSDLTAKQVEAILAEPMLVAAIVDL